MGVCERESERERVELRVCLWPCEGETRRLFAFVLVCLWRKEKGREREKGSVSIWARRLWLVHESVCVCVCAYDDVREREKQRERERKKQTRWKKTRVFMMRVCRHFIRFHDLQIQRKKIGANFFLLPNAEKTPKPSPSSKKSTLLFRRKNDSPAKVFKKRSKRRTSFTRK